MVLARETKYAAVLPICLSHAEHDRGQDVLPLQCMLCPNIPKTHPRARQAAEDGCLSTFVNGCNDLLQRLRNVTEELQSTKRSYNPESHIFNHLISVIT